MWGRAIRVARLAGFDIKIDASWLLIAALIVWSLATGYFRQLLPASPSSTLLALAVIAMVGLFVSLILHEMAHAVMARRFGVQTAGITLFLFGGVAELTSEPQDAKSEMAIAIVGPLASLGLAALFWAAGQAGEAIGSSPSAIAVLDYLALINVTLAVFNLVPAFPLDGGRVFRALLWSRSGDLVRATQRAVQASAVFSWMLIALGLSHLFLAGSVMGLWPVMVGVFLLAIARGAYRQVETEHALRGRTVEDLMTRQPVVARPDMSLETLVDSVFLAHAVSFAPVVEGSTLLGYVDTRTVRRIDRENWPTTTVEDVFEGTSDDNCVPPSLTGKALMERIGASGRRKFLVVENGKLAGLVTLSDLVAFLSVLRELASQETTLAGAPAVPLQS